MAVCCCFGHKFIARPEEVKEKVKQAMIFAIKNKNITEFHVGHNGSFDFLCASCVKELKKDFPFLKSYLVLAYLKLGDEVKEYYVKEYFDGTVYPDLEKTPPKFAILKRNKIMVRNADYIIFYCSHPGRTRELMEFAQHKNKDLINLCKY